MPRFACNLNWLFGEWPYLDRFAAAADAGFTAVETIAPWDHAPDAIAQRLEDNGLTLALFNLPGCNPAGDTYGLAALPDRFDEFRDSVARALDLARATGVHCAHMMSGRADPNDPEARKSYERAMHYAAEAFAPLGVTLMLEPINTRDIPGYYLRDFPMAETLVETADLPNVKLQFDIYHRQIVHGDVTVALRRLMPIIGHIQVASVPSRNEPDGEELNFPFLFAELDRLGYTGFVAGEYRPRGHTIEGLGWAKAYQDSAG